ncbi:metal ABC transporter ATP-binding protein [Vibrio salinus]|uniref:metal ABC transporter ATP-binding protein n=1 Tax=Vibrio salinus TaxID=2899784 RepID=UPI001E5684CC|nr:ATP-binding cassette domain-containing protein [Vibrio salinus]MCE0495010.1 ATP-binding cassette domain-containing protein [Vibrio salinus]
MTETVNINVSSVGVTYNNGVEAITDVSFSLSGGTICALVGINGGGKSTLFKCLMGLVKTTDGDIQISGRPVNQALKFNQIAYVPQSEDIDWNFPILVKDVVLQGRYGHMGFFRRPGSDDLASIERSMRKMGIFELKDRQIGELSGGQKKRVFLARALAQESKIILLDEPFTGVDFTTEEAIIALLRELRDAGHLVLVSTHNLGVVPDYCDDVIFINRRIIAAGKTSNTFTQQNLEATFGGVLKQVGILGKTLHNDNDDRGITILSDHEKPAVFYGSGMKPSQIITDNQKSEDDIC